MRNTFMKFALMVCLVLATGAAEAATPNPGLLPALRDKLNGSGGGPTGCTDGQFQAFNTSTGEWECINNPGAGSVANPLAGDLDADGNDIVDVAAINGTNFADAMFRLNALPGFYVKELEDEFPVLTPGNALIGTINVCNAAGGGVIYVPDDGTLRIITEEERAVMPALGDCHIDGGGFVLDPGGGAPLTDAGSVYQVGGSGLTAPAGPLFTINKSGTVIANVAIVYYRPSSSPARFGAIMAGDGVEGIRTDLDDSDASRTTKLTNVTIANVYVGEDYYSSSFTDPSNGWGIWLDDVQKSTVMNVLTEGFNSGLYLSGVASDVRVSGSRFREAEDCGLQVEQYATFRILPLSNVTTESNFRGVCVGQEAYGVLSDHQSYYENGARGTLADRANVLIESDDVAYDGRTVRFSGNANIPVGRDFVATAGLADASPGVAQKAHTADVVRFGHGTTITGTDNRMQVSHVYRTATTSTFLPVGSVYGGNTVFTGGSDCQAFLEAQDVAFLYDRCFEDDGDGFWVSGVDAATGRGTGTVTLTSMSAATVPAASTTVAGIVELATAAETEGSGTLTAVTPFGLFNWDGSASLQDFMAGAVNFSELDPSILSGSDSQLITGTPTTGECAEFDANGDVIGAGAACGSGSGSSIFEDQGSYYETALDLIVGGDGDGTCDADEVCMRDGSLTVDDIVTRAPSGVAPDFITFREGASDGTEYAVVSSPNPGTGGWASIRSCQLEDSNSPFNGCVSRIFTADFFTSDADAFDTAGDPQCARVPVDMTVSGVTAYTGSSTDNVMIEVRANPAAVGTNLLTASIAADTDEAAGTLDSGETAISAGEYLCFVPAGTNAVAVGANVRGLY